MIRTWLWAVAAAASVYAGSAAAQVTHSALLDLDSNTATGCTVVTVAGSVPGVEARITATVTGQPPVVTSVTREQCTGAGFGAPTAQPAGYPVGVNLGTGGADVVEFATSLTGLGQGGPAIITFVSQTALGADLVVVPGVILPGQIAAPTQPAIIPATGLLALVLLALLVLWLVRKHPGIGSTMALLFLFGAGVVWAANFVTDGAIGDWTGHPPRATDANNDATSSEMTIEIVAVFAETEGGNLYLRVDVRDAQNQPPVANAPAATVLNEDGSATITLTGSDPEGAPLTFAIATAPTRGTLGAITPINATSASVLYTATANQNGADSFTFTVNDGSSSSAPATAAITINAVNDAPTVTAATFPVVENSPNGTVVGTAAATDVDTGQTLTWSITAGNTGGAFAINPATGQITVADTTDIIPANSPFALTVQATDNGAPPLNGSNTITVNVTGVNDEPSFAAGPNQNATEDDPAVTVNNWATTISAGPPDEAGQTLAFTVSNDANALFSVQPAIAANGTLTYTPAPNANGVANVSVFLQDNGGTAAGGDDTSPTVNFTITIAAVNDTPSFMLPAAPNQNVLQNSGPATVAGFASALSAGPADESAQTLSFNVSNDNNALFSAQPAIAPNGTLTFTPANGQIGSATVSVTISDSAGGISAAQTFIINVSLVNQAPSFTLPADPAAVNEDAAAQTVPGFITGIDDGDAAVTQTVSFVIDNVSNGALFQTAPAIANDGTLTYAPLANANGTAVVTFHAMDDGGTANGGVNVSPTDTFTITVNAVNDTPSFVLPANPNQSVPQDSPAQTVNGFATAISRGPADENGQTLTFTVNVTVGGALFTVAPDIDEATGNLTYTPAAGAVGTANISVTLMDNGGGADTSAAQTFSITLEDVNEAPVPTTVPPSPITIAENTPVSTSVTDIAPNDPDVGQTHAYAFVSGNTGGAFAVDANGVITVAGPLDFEGPNDPYTLVVSVTDNGTPVLSANISITVNLSDVNEAPAFTSPAAFSVPEDTTPVGTVAATDPEANPITFSITGGADGALFSINPGTGALAFLAPPNFEAPADAGANNVYDVVVTASDGTNTPTQAIAVTVTNTNDAPVFTSAAAVNSPENQVAAHTVTTTDGDLDTVTYSITGGADASLLMINPTSGAVAFLAPPNFEAPGDAGGNNVYDIVVTASDGTASPTQAIAITVTDVNEAPAITSPNAFSVAENTTAVGSATATDPESNPITFSITGGVDAADLAINPTTGAISFNTAPDFELPADADTNNSYLIQVTATDGTTPTNQAVTVTVTNVNEGPTFTSANAGNVPENTAGTAFTATALDTEGDTITFAIVGGADAGDLTINPSTGAISFNTPPDFEAPGDADTNNSYVVDLTATATGGSANQTLTLTVTNVNEAPVITSGAPASVPENTAGTFHTVTATDPDLTTPTFALSGGADQADFTINPTTGALSFAVTPNFEAPADADTDNVYQVTVRATDGALFDDEPYSITVTNVNEAPTAVADAYDYLGNIELRIAGHAGTANALSFTTDVDTLIANDTDPDSLASGFANLAAVAVAPTETGTGSVYTIATDGTMTYTPGAGDTAVDTIPYQLTDGANTVAGSISFTRVGTDMVWFVRNNDPTADAFAGNNGTSSDPFNTLAAAETASGVDHIIYVHVGDGAVTGQNAGIVLKNGQDLIGNGVALSANGGATTIAAGAQPQIGNAAGVGVSAPNLTGTVAIRGLNIGSAGANNDGVLATTTASAGVTLDISDNTIRGTGTTAQGIDVEVGSGTVNLSLHDNNVTSTGTGFELTRTAGTFTITAFDDNVATGAVGSHGIDINTAVFDATPGGGFQQVSGGTTAVGVLGDRVTNIGVRMQNVTGDLSFANLTVFNNNGNGLQVSSSGVFNAGAGTGFRIASTGLGDIIESNGGAGVTISNATISLAPTRLTVTGGGTNSLNLDTVAGTFSAGNTSSITSTAAGATAYRITNSSVNAIYNGSITATNSTGVSLTANTGTMAFTGVLTLNTAANPAFVATGGGTVSASNTTSTLGTTTGIALNVANTTIAAAGLNFRSIGANGAVNGIVLDTTGGLGGLTVTGSGSATQGGDNSGGTLQTTSDAIRLNNTRNVVLTNMRIQNVGSGPADNARGIEAINLQGTNRWRAGTMTGLGQVGGAGGADRNAIHVVNVNTPLTLLSVENSVFSNSDSGTSHVFTSAQGTSTMNVDVVNNDFSDLVALAVQVNAGDAENGVHAVTTNITNNVFRNSAPGDSQGSIAVASADQDATTNVNISGNTFIDLIKGIAGGNSEILLTQTTGGSMTGTVATNTIGNATFGNGDRRGIGVIVEPDVSSNGELGSIDLIHDGNRVDRLTDREAIFVDLREDATDSELIVRNNLLGQLVGFEGQIGGIREALDVQTRGEVTRTFNMGMTNNQIRTTSSIHAVNLEVNIDNATPGNLTMHSTLTGNTIRNTGIGTELIARPRDAGAVTTLCVDMNGNTIDGGGGQLDLNETGVLNVEQASAAALAAANGIPGGNVLITGTAPSFAVACSAPPL